MKIEWVKLLRSIPGSKKALDGLVAPGASSSATVWYNVVKAAITILAAVGIYVGMSEEDIQALGATLAVGIPAVLTIFDMVANVWLRTRTKEPLDAKVDKPK